jgi:SAM-dependent methyltransferase
MSKTATKINLNSMPIKAKPLIPSIFSRARQWNTITAEDVKIAQETFNEQGLYESILSFAKSWHEKTDRHPRVLDLCSSSGLAAFHIAQKIPVSSITLVDTDLDALHSSKKIFQDSSYPVITQCADAVNFTNPEKYDLILMNSAYHHIENDRKVAFLKNASQNLASGGIIILGENFLPQYDNYEEHLHSVEKFYTELLAELSTRGASQGAIDVVATAGYYCWRRQFEYKVSWEVFQEDINISNLIVSHFDIVWSPKSADKKYGSIAVSIINKTYDK